MANQSIKNNLIMILDILRRHSDAEHRLTQKDILQYLQSEYDMNCDRKTVKRNLMNLIEFGFDIEYTEIERTSRESNTIITDIYFNHPFENSEVNLICDSLLFSKYLSANKTKQLIEKVHSLASPFSNNMLKDAINYETLGHTENTQIFYTIDALNKAIKKHRQVIFSYCEYGQDKKLHPKQNHQYLINPYYTVTANGRYYLIGNVDKYNNLANFRIDKIKETKICDSAAKPIQHLDGCEHGFRLSSYMKEHIYMFTGKSVSAKIKIDTSIMDQVIDWFGKEFSVISSNKNTCTISLTVNEQALFYWAMQYGNYAEVLFPKSVRRQLAEAAQQMAEKYQT